MKNNIFGQIAEVPKSTPPETFVSKTAPGKNVKLKKKFETNFLLTTPSEKRSSDIPA
jgi:hypothetical protein